MRLIYAKAGWLFAGRYSFIQSLDWELGTLNSGNDTARPH